MENLKNLYSQKINIMKYFRENGDEPESNSMNAVLCAYDYQAGSYTEGYYSKEVIKDKYMYKGTLNDMTSGEYTRLAAHGLAEIMKGMDFHSILEVGTGEATTICDLMNELDKDIQAWGIELSLSRLLYAQKFEEQKKVNINMAVGDMFSLPFSDDSIDVVFTYYCIDSHRGKEKRAIEEMLRVAKKYVVLVEPSYELGNDETKKRIDEMKYIKNILGTLKDIDAEVVEHRLFDVYTINNNAAVTVLKKKKQVLANNASYACPVCKKELVHHKGNMYCKECFNLYPIINKIPILLKDNAILCSKYLEF